MLAVLPFENLGQSEDRYFATGMTDEITSRLSTVPELGVISRTSAMQYEKTNKSLKQIGQELGVDYVLEGSIRWSHSGASSKVRVTPQLVRVSDDTQIWSEIYDRVINDVFQVQSEIAESVITQLGITLVDRQKATLAEKPTQNMEAYQSYLRGRELQASPSYDIAVYNSAIANFKNAIRIDPNFAHSYAWLGIVNLSLFHEGYDVSPERLVIAKNAIDKAIQLNSELPYARVALGYYHYYGFREYDRALQEFNRASQNSPNDSQILAAIAFVERRQGKYEDSINHFKKAMELDPRNANLPSSIAVILTRLRKYTESESYSDKALRIAPEQVYLYGMKQFNRILWKGDLEGSRRILEEMPDREPTFYHAFWLDQETLERNYEAAITRFDKIPVELFQEEARFTPKSLWRAEILSYMKKDDLARKYFDQARIFLEDKLKERSQDPPAHASLGRAYAGLGRKEDAIREGTKAKELSPASVDKFMGAEYVRDMAVIYTMVGEYDKALNELDSLLSGPSWFSVKMLSLEPAWDPLRSHPRYKEIIQKYSTD